MEYTNNMNEETKKSVEHLLNAINDYVKYDNYTVANLLCETVVTLVKKAKKESEVNNG